MKKILLFLFASCFMNISAQTDGSRRKPKTNSSVPATVRKAKSQPQSKPSVSSPTIGKSTYIPDVITFTVKGVSFQMVEVQGGTFNMGATSEQGSDAFDDEKPVHRVTLSDYYIGQTEVTQALWQAVMGSNPSHFKGDNLPVESVSWNYCQTFISKLNALTGRRFRLPTEAEWEFAARGGTKSRGYKHSGSKSIGDVAWYGDNSDSETNIAGTKAPNELGIYDMSGNVWEWCSDWKGNYNNYAQTNPTGPSAAYGRVFRGGCWHHSAKACRVSYRRDGNPDYGDSYLGLRLCLSK